MEANSEKLERLERIFVPTANQRINTLIAGKGRLVHYTTAENALNIIKTREIWLRNARAMQDYSELHHGVRQLAGLLRDQTFRKRFDLAYSGVADNVLQDAINLFDTHWGQLEANTYVTCLSEHLPSEDSRGRLSMWRAFGKNVASVAIVLNCPEKNSALPLQLSLVPVMYYSDTNLLKEEIERIIQNISDNRDFLKTIHRNELVGWQYVMLHSAAIAIKHPSFDEEREWRLCHSPVLAPSEHVLPETETLNGIPQVVYKLKLKNKPEFGINNIELNQQLDRIIVGPSQYNRQIAQAFARELELLGFSDFNQRVYVSDIPIRG